MQIKNSIFKIFAPDYTNYDGVSRIKIYLLRLVFFLTLVFVGKDSWTVIIAHEGTWQPLEAVAFCVWAAYSTLSILGLFHTLRMLPVILFQISYKTIWLIVVAYPLWSTNKLEGSPAEGLTHAFLWVILPIMAMPWTYLFRNYFRIQKTPIKKSTATAI